MTLPAARVRALLVAGTLAAIAGATLPQPVAAVPRGTAPAPPPAVAFTRASAQLGGDRRPVAGDFDGDGADDIAWYGGGTDEVAFGGPSAAFTTVALSAPEDQKAVAGDFDGDGRDDLVWYGPGTDVLAAGRGNRTFVDHALSTPDGARPAVGDFNGDGNDDVLWYADGADRLDLGQPDETFDTGSTTAPDDAKALVGDLDGDGRDDVLWYRAGIAGDSVRYGNPDGTFTKATVTVNGTYRPFTGDFDGDGRDDVFWFGYGAAPDRVWYGNASRAFSPATVSIDGPYRPVAANFHPSGTDVRTDVLWYAEGAAPDPLWRGTGTRGSFATSIEDRGGTFAGVVGDFDASTGADIVWHRQGPRPDQVWTSSRRPTLTVETFISDGDLPDGSIGVPWDLAFTPDGALLFDERSGDLDVRLPDGTVRQLVADQSDVYAVGEGGVLGLAVDPAFATNRRFYTCQGQQTGAAYDIQVVAWQVDAGYTTATRVADPLLGGLPVAPPSAPSPGRHSGCRLRFGPDGYLWIGTGDVASPTVPQDRASLGGKVLRIDAVTGAAAPDNPFVGDTDPTTDPRVYNYGHRNVQGLAWRTGTRQMWSVEHGTFRDDEVNRLRPGANYGYDPVPLSGPLFYDESRPMTDLTRHPGALVANRSSGNPTNAWSGAHFLTGGAWGTWEGALAVAALKDSQLHVMFFTRDGTYVRQEIPAELDGTHGRLRTPIQGPDGALYLTTSDSSGNAILRITPG